jgi:hypothetical protein
MHCKLQIHLENFPMDAFVKKERGDDVYYQIVYTVGLVLGPGGIEFRALHGGKVVGSIEFDYI